MRGEVSSDSVSVVIEERTDREENVPESPVLACPHPYPRLSRGRRDFFRFPIILLTPVSFLYGGVFERVYHSRSAYNAFFNSIRS